MNYNIKAIPTTYAGVNFRSRLEARWAAFFDLCGWKWDYEPFDLDGWAPDFLIKTKFTDVLAEIKPLDIERVLGTAEILEFEKACNHSIFYQVMCLGYAPLCKSVAPGSILMPPNNATYVHEDVVRELSVPQFDKETGELYDHDELWREAGNRVQWNRHEEQPSAAEIVRRAVNKARIAA
ncbi:hypothetical protein [Mesorhizobium sp.]|uniref:hypothetical protein n=1 Tax=Mesorhizobium sp. TaxID=1871066 RepID=UPI0011FC8967|nr:hypothetical protein [Mesorhizobium sp.]TIN83117.1 MAG: hypothetical protein E5X97_27695 [Mesorhizobium sp.]